MVCVPAGWLVFWFTWLLNQQNGSFVHLGRLPRCGIAVARDCVFYLERRWASRRTRIAAHPHNGSGKKRTKMSSCKEAACALTAEGFEVLLDYDDEDARRAFAHGLRVQPEHVLRSAICMTTESVGRRCMGEDKWRHEHLHHFHIKYGDGPTYVACVAKPDGLCTREGVRRLMAKLRPHFTVSVGVRFTYGNGGAGDVTVDTSMEVDAFRVAKIQDASAPAHEKVAQSMYICRMFQDEAADDVLDTLREQGRLPPSACGACGQVLGGHRYEVRPRASGDDFALEVTAYPACVVCIPADTSATVALGDPEVARAVLRDRLLTELRARAGVRTYAVGEGETGETGEQAMTRCARLASAVCAIPKSRVDDALRVTVETAALQTARAHPHTAGVLRRPVEHVGGEAARAVLQALLHGARKCHACGHFKDADAYTANQWRQRQRRCRACAEAGVARGAYLDSVDARAAEDDDCPICFEAVADPAARRTLHGDVRHWVCAACLRDMQTYGLTCCPTCRAELP